MLAILIAIGKGNCGMLILAYGNLKRNGISSYAGVKSGGSKLWEKFCRLMVWATLLLAIGKGGGWWYICLIYH